MDGLCVTFKANLGLNSNNHIHSHPWFDITLKQMSYGKELDAINRICKLLLLTGTRS